MRRFLCLSAVTAGLGAVEEAKSGGQLSICLGEPLHHIVLGPSLWTFSLLAFAVALAVPVLAAALERVRRRRAAPSALRQGRMPPSAT